MSIFGWMIGWWRDYPVPTATLTRVRALTLQLRGRREALAAALPPKKPVPTRTLNP